METLPELALLRIFKELDYKDQRSCSKVCWKWRNMIDSHIGKIVYVGKGNKEIWGDRVRYFQDIRIISTIGVSECTVSGKVGEDIRNFKYPHLVKSLKFDTLLSGDKYNFLVKDLTNLRELKLHEGFMNNAFEAGTVSLRFPKLKSFELVYEQLRFGTNYSLMNIIGLLDGIFSPQLEVLTLHFPCFREIELYLLGYLFKCMERHKLSLNSLRLKFFRVSVDIQVEEVLHSMLGPPPSLMLSDFQNMDLRSIDIKTEEYDGTRIIDQYFTDLLFSHLSTLRFYRNMQLFPSFSFPIQMILNNSSTLVCINITYYGVDSLIDCSESLSQCSSLKSLTLENGSEYEDYADNIDNGRVIGLMSLPKSLEFIQLTFISTTREDLTSLALEFPNLKNLYLVNTVDEFGGTLEASVVVEILTRKQIIQIVIALHNEVPEEWISTLKCSETSQPIIKNILKDINKYKYFIAVHLDDGNYKMGLLKDNTFQCMGTMVPCHYYFVYPPTYLRERSGVWHKLISAVRRVRNRVYRFFGRIGY